jgi:hypothetical protein
VLDLDGAELAHGVTPFPHPVVGEAEELTDGDGTGRPLEEPLEDPAGIVEPLQLHVGLAEVLERLGKLRSQPQSLLVGVQ